MNLTELQMVVIRQLEPDSMEDLQNTIKDIASHGIDGGFHGFIYYKETSDFHDKNEGLLWETLEEDAKDFGYKTPMEFVGTFKTEASDITTLKNVISWYVVEKVAFELSENDTFNRLNEEDFAELMKEVNQ